MIFWNKYVIGICRYVYDLIYLILGEYICEVRDFGIVQNKFDLVDVIIILMVDIDLMVDYVFYGGLIRI